MIDHKFTDEEIIKALECCYKGNHCRSDCPYDGEDDSCVECTSMLAKDALALINRQKAEIEDKRDQSLYLATKIHEKNAEVENLRNALERANYYGFKADEEIEYLKAEIERLNKEVDRLSQCVLYHDGIVSDLEKDVFNAKAEAIKEFAESLKANMSNIARMEYGGNIYFCVGYGLIDNLVKEMTEGKTNGCEEV